LDQQFHTKFVRKSCLASTGVTSTQAFSNSMHCTKCTFYLVTSTFLLKPQHTANINILKFMFHKVVQSHTLHT